MAVTNDTIMQKMQKELTQAKQLSTDETAMKNTLQLFNSYANCCWKKSLHPHPQSAVTSQRQK